MAAVACTSGQPMQDPIDANIDTAWLHAGEEDASGPTPDAIVLGGPDAGDATVSDAADGASDAPSDAVGTTSGDAEDVAGCTITSCGTRSVCTSGLCVLARRVFVSSSTLTGNLGGYSGADATCQTLANAAGLGGAWMAWISDSSSSPSARFNQASYEYALLDGTIVASDWASLTSGTLAHGIDQDEHGQPVDAGTTEVWTATATDGGLFADGCDSFGSSSSSAPTVEVGVSGNVDATWTQVYAQFCSRTDHLYCIEQ